MMQPNGDVAHTSEALPEQVFHYTSIDAMIKIIDTRSVWCTALPYLNDSKERIFLFDAVRRRLPILKENDNSFDTTILLRALNEVSGDAHASLADEAFVACFARNSDSLMHWRAYCPQQAGVAIGFRSCCLGESPIAEKPLPGMLVNPCYFARVGYLNTKDDAVIDDVIHEAYESAKKGTARDPRSTLGDHFRWALGGIACLCKEKAFEVEDEFRLLLTSVRYRENNMQFRSVRSTLIPYVAMAIPN
jgi:hypothetical protein